MEATVLNVVFYNAFICMNYDMSYTTRRNVWYVLNQSSVCINVKVADEYKASCCEADSRIMR